VVGDLVYYGSTTLDLNAFPLLYDNNTTTTITLVAIAVSFPLPFFFYSGHDENETNERL